MNPLYIDQTKGVFGLFPSFSFHHVFSDHRLVRSLLQTNSDIAMLAMSRNILLRKVLLCFWHTHLKFDRIRTANVN